VTIGVDPMVIYLESKSIWETWSLTSSSSYLLTNYHEKYKKRCHELWLEMVGGENN